MKYIIEHLEPELYPWCILEYAHISEIVGSENLIISNIRKKADCDKLNELGCIEKKSVLQLRPKNACILDPEAEETLAQDAAKLFDFFIFGGILGDDPPKERTKPMLTDKLSCKAFNLGKEQMSTDTAVAVVNKIISGTPIDKIKFKQGITIPISDGEEVILPYKYIMENNRVLIAKGLIDYLKEVGF